MEWRELGAWHSQGRCGGHARRAGKLRRRTGELRRRIGRKQQRPGSSSVRLRRTHGGKQTREEWPGGGEGGGRIWRWYLTAGILVNAPHQVFFPRSPNVTDGRLPTRCLR
jgi:hypothetical protein